MFTKPPRDADWLPASLGSSQRELSCRFSCSWHAPPPPPPNAPAHPPALCTLTRLVWRVLFAHLFVFARYLCMFFRIRLSVSVCEYMWVCVCECVLAVQKSAIWYYCQLANTLSATWVTRQDFQANTTSLSICEYLRVSEYLCAHSWVSVSAQVCV